GDRPRSTRTLVRVLSRLFNYRPPLRDFGLEELVQGFGPRAIRAHRFGAELREVGLEVRVLDRVLSAAFKRSTTGFGVPLGTYSPCQTSTSKPLIPCSTSVGMFGSEGTRFLLVTPNTFTLPPW